MAISYVINKHAVCYTSKVLAVHGGKHIYNIQLTADHDNGNVVAKGDWVELDLYKEKAAAATTEGVIRGQAANGNWYVEVVKPEDGLLIRQTPMIEEEYNSAFKDLANFYNKTGDVVRAYELAAGDIFELSEAGFDGTPEAGKTVKVASYKWKVAAD